VRCSVLHPGGRRRRRHRHHQRQRRHPDHHSRRRRLRLDDTVSEPTESFTLAVGGVAATGTINDNDPIAVNDGPLSTDEDTPLTAIKVLANDFDPDDDPLTVTSATSNQGTVAINPDGTLDFTPNQNFNGPATITYTITDGNGGTSSATVAINVNPVNDAPVANDASIITDEDTPINGSLPAATDVDGDEIIYALGTAAAHGTVSIGADGTYTYTPNANYHGSDSFTYTVSDDQGGVNTYTVSVLVNPVNDAPIFGNTNRTANVSEEGLPNGVPDTTGSPTDTTNAVIASGTFAISDIDSPNVTVTLTAPTTTLTSNGAPVTWSGTGTSTLSASAGGSPVMTINITDTGYYTVTLHKAVDHAIAGVEDILSLGIIVTASDGEAISTGLLTVNIEDDAPLAVNDFATLMIGESTAGNVLANDLGADLPGRVQSVVYQGTTYTATNGVITVDTGKGILLMNGDGTYTYESKLFTTTGGSNGLADWSDVSITAFNGARNVASQNEFFIDPVTFAPLAANILSISGTGVLTVVDGALPDGTDGLGIAGGAGSATYLNGHPTNPEAIMLNLGHEANSLNANFYSGTNSGVPFYWATYDASGNLMETGNGLVNKPGFTLNVENSSGDPFQYVVFYGIDTSASSKILLVGLDSIQFSDTGPDEFVYTLVDADGDTSAARLAISQTEPSNTAPIAANDSYTTTEDTAVTLNVLANDSDTDGDAFLLWGYTQAANGTVSTDVNGNLVYTPNADWSGIDTFTYTLRDSKGGVDTATVSVNVTPVADAPTVYAHSTNQGMSAGDPVFAANFNSGTLGAWSRVRLTGNTFAEINGGNGKTSTEAALFSSVAWNGQTTTTEFNNFWTLNNGAVSYNLNGGAGSDDAQGMLAYTSLTTAQRALTSYVISADMFADASSVQANGIGLVFGYVDANNYFLARWENPSAQYAPSGNLFNSYPGQYQELSLVQMVNGQPIDLARATFNGDDWFNMNIRVSNTGIGVTAVDTSSGVTATLNYTYGSVTNGATTAPALNTIGLYTFDNDSVVRWDNVTVNQGVYSYLLHTEASLNDTDGSEILSAITLGNIPAGVTLTDTVTNSVLTVTNGSATVIAGNEIRMTTTTPLTDAQINAMQVSVTSTESDGSSASDSSNVKIDVLGTSGAETLTGSTGDDWLTGGTGNDTLIGSAGSDVLIGGAGNDTLTGGLGADVFKWELADQGTVANPAIDTITDFDSLANSDKLDLRDLLQGESHSGTDAGNLADYLHFSYNSATSTTVIEVKSQGTAMVGPDQIINLSGVDLVTGYTSDQQIIQDLLSKGKLITD